MVFKNKIKNINIMPSIKIDHIQVVMEIYFYEFNSWLHFFLRETGIFILFKKTVWVPKGYRWQGVGTSAIAMKTKILFMPMTKLTIVLCELQTCHVKMAIKLFNNKRNLQFMKNQSYMWGCPGSFYDVSWFSSTWCASSWSCAWLSSTQTLSENPGAIGTC